MLAGRPSLCLKESLFSFQGPILLFPSPPVHVQILWWLYRMNHLQLISLSHACSTVSFSSLSSSKYLFPIFAFLQIYTVVNQNGKVRYSADSRFLLIIRRSGILPEIRWSVFNSKSQRIVCFSFSRMDSGLCIYHLDTLPTHSSLVLYSFFAFLL